MKVRQGEEGNLVEETRIDSMGNTGIELEMKNTRNEVGDSDDMRD